jgi:hypothetical protein
MTGSRPKLLLGLSLLATFPVAWVISPFVIAPSDVTVCFFKSLTNRDCPFCGLTRALASAMHGNFQAAFAFHPFWWLAAMLIAGTGIVAMRDGLAGGNQLERLRGRTKFLDFYIVLALIGFWLNRICA